MVLGEHRLQVSVGLVLSFVVYIIAAVVAVADPFSIDSPWLAWIVLSILGTVGVIAAVVLASMTDNEKDFWGLLVAAWAIYLVAGAFVSGLFTATDGGIDLRFSSLVWTAYAVPLLVMPVSSLVMYLTMARVSAGAEKMLRRTSRV